jgi:predicted DNA-binding antitoxin AbrB/MazE fold protein
MTTTVKAVYQDGVFKPKEPVQLKEKTEVEVLIPEEVQKQDDDDPTGWKTARELIGCIKEKPLAPNISEDHDRYIYRK